MKVHIEITDEQHQKLLRLKNSENRPMQFLISQAIENYLISKRLSPWDKLPKSKQSRLKKKALKIALTGNVNKE
jgi:hypothetical protein